MTKGLFQVSLSDRGEDGVFTPKTELLLFPLGEIATEHGVLHMDADDAAAVMEHYRLYTAKRDGRLSLDYAHGSMSESADPMAHIAAGSFLLELRDDGIWMTDIQYTKRAREFVAAGEFPSFSPVALHDKAGHIRKIRNVALTSIPASWEAGLLAADVLDRADTDQSLGVAAPAKEISMKPANATPRLIALALAMGYKAKIDAVAGASRKSLGLNDDGQWAYVEECYEDHAIVCAYGLSGPGPSEKSFKVPYTIADDGAVTLGEMTEVEKTFAPKGSEAAVQMSLTRGEEFESKLLSVTGAASRSEALIAVEAAIRDAAAKAPMEQRLQTLEQREFTRERTVLLSAAKRDGKWTKDQEDEADEKAALARRLGDDPVVAMSTFWRRAPPVIAPGGHQEDVVVITDPSEVKLSAAEIAACEDQARQFPSMSVEKLQAAMLDTKRKDAARNRV